MLLDGTTVIPIKLKKKKEKKRKKRKRKKENHECCILKIKTNFA